MTSPRSASTGPTGPTPTGSERWKSCGGKFTAPNMLSKDFKEFVELLHAHEVRHLVIGGYAVALHGHPRYTKDIDIWIDRTEANAEKLLLALHAFGFESLGLTIGDLTGENQVIQLGYEPLRIDLLTSAPGLPFEEAFEARLETDVDGTTVFLINLPHLIQIKQAAGRPQDIADIDHLS